MVGSRCGARKFCPSGAASASRIGPWVIHDESRFVWIVGDDDFSEANAVFYNSPERSALEPRIPEYLDKVEAWMLDSVGA